MRVAEGTQHVVVDNIMVNCQLTTDFPKFDFKDVIKKCSSVTDKGIKFFKKIDGVEFYLDTERNEFFAISDAGKRVIIANDCMMVWMLNGGEMYMNIDSPKGVYPPFYLYQIWTS